MEIGKQIRIARKEERMSQQALADAVGVHKITICKIETGVMSPSLSTMEMIAEKLGYELVLVKQEHG